MSDRRCAGCGTALREVGGLWTCDHATCPGNLVKRASVAPIDDDMHFVLGQVWAGLLAVGLVALVLAWERAADREWHIAVVDFACSVWFLSGAWSASRRCRKYRLAVRS